MKTGLFISLSPLLVVVLGGSLLMLAEAFSHHREEHDARNAGPSSELAIGTMLTLFTGRSSRPSSRSSAPRPSTAARTSRPG